MAAHRIDVLRTFVDPKMVQILTLLRIDNGGLALISHRFTFLLIAS